MKTIEGYTYKVAETIGKGYSSTVHRGLRDCNGEEVSIKVIEMSKLEDPINQMLLQLEVAALKALTASPHVLHLHDVYATRNNTYLITELCQGDLGSMLKQRKVLPYFEAVEIMRQLILGYADISRAGFLHRDIKPANIFYKNGVYKYGDFGFAIPAVEVNNHKHYNVGSPVYMPPQALKDNVYSVSCDVWALGIIFFQLIKGVVPWRAVSQQVLHDKMVSEHIDTLTGGLPDVARKFLGQILCLDSKQRLTPEELLAWPAQLQSIQMENRNISPFQQRPRAVGNALREVNSNLVPLTPIHSSVICNTKPSTVYFNQNSTISPHNCSSNNQNKPYASKQQNQVQNGSNWRELDVKQGEDVEYKQAYFLANNAINYIKFLHRVVKFMGSSPVDLERLENCIVKYMYQQLDALKNILQGKESNEIKVEGWTQFLKSSKGNLMRKKLKKYESKYKMFHQFTHDQEELQQRGIMEGINAIIAYLDQIDIFKPRLVVAADYLTTLYQLLHLRAKYELTDFVKISKIDLIMQGNPYSTTTDHLTKLRKKLLLIRP